MFNFRLYVWNSLALFGGIPSLMGDEKTKAFEGAQSRVNSIAIKEEERK